MSEPLADVLAALSEKATPGPFRVVREYPDYGAPYDAAINAGADRRRCFYDPGDAELFAALRNSTAQIIAALRLADAVDHHWSLPPLALGEKECTDMIDAQERTDAALEAYRAAREAAK